MSHSALEQAILEQFNRLDTRGQQQVLDLAKSLAGSRTKGEPGRELIRFVGSIPPEELRSMMQAIEEGCERIDPNGW